MNSLRKAISGLVVRGRPSGAWLVLSALVVAGLPSIAQAQHDFSTGPLYSASASTSNRALEYQYEASGSGGSPLQFQSDPGQFDYAFGQVRPNLGGEARAIVQSSLSGRSAASASFEYIVTIPGLYDGVAVPHFFNYFLEYETKAVCQTFEEDEGPCQPGMDAGTVFAQAIVELTEVDNYVNPLTVGFLASDVIRSSQFGFDVVAGEARVNLYRGKLYRVRGEAGGNTDGLAYARINVDPTFRIDPDWAVANPDYAAGVRLSGVPTAVPEPATWALMIGGFGLAGAALRRRLAAA